MYVLFDKETLRIADYGYVGDLDARLAQFTGLTAIEGRAPSGCLYVKHTENGWEFDPDRLPDPPEPGCVWEYPRWVTLAERRARYNMGLQAQINQVEAGQPRALRQLEIARARPTTVADLKDAADRLIDIETRVAALRAQWWQADMAAPPEVLPTQEL